jgi:hypothetical protein
MRNDQQFKGDPAKSEAKNATFSGICGMKSRNPNSRPER